STGGGVDLTAEGNVQLNTTILSGGTLSLTGPSVRFNKNVVLSGDTVIDTTDSGAVSLGGDIAFLGTINAGSLGQNLMLDAGTNGNISFGGTVGNSKRPGTITINDAKDVTIGALFQVGSLQQLTGHGTTTISGAVDANGGAGGSVTLVNGSVVIGLTSAAKP